MAEAKVGQSSTQVVGLDLGRPEWLAKLTTRVELEATNIDKNIEEGQKKLDKLTKDIQKYNEAEKAALIPIRDRVQAAVNADFILKMSNEMDRVKLDYKPLQQEIKEKKTVIQEADNDRSKYADAVKFLSFFFTSCLSLRESFEEKLVEWEERKEAEQNKVYKNAIEANILSLEQYIDKLFLKAQKFALQKNKLKSSSVAHSCNKLSYKISACILHNATDRIEALQKSLKEQLAKIAELEANLRESLEELNSQLKQQPLEIYARKLMHYKDIVSSMITRLVNLSAKMQASWEDLVDFQKTKREEELKKETRDAFSKKDSKDELLVTKGSENKNFMVAFCIAIWAFLASFFLKRETNLKLS